MPQREVVVGRTHVYSGKSQHYSTINSPLSVFRRIDFFIISPFFFRFSFNPGAGWCLNSALYISNNWSSVARIGLSKWMWAHEHTIICITKLFFHSFGFVSLPKCVCECACVCRVLCIIHHKNSHSNIHWNMTRERKISKKNRNRNNIHINVMSINIIRWELVPSKQRKERKRHFEINKWNWRQLCK